MYDIVSSHKADLPGKGGGWGIERVNDFASKTGKRADVKKH